MAIQLVVYGIVQAIYGVLFCLSMFFVLFVPGAFVHDVFYKRNFKAMEFWRDRVLLALCFASLATLGASALFPFTLAVVCTSLATSLGIFLLLAVNWSPQDAVTTIWLLCALATPPGIMSLWAYQHPDAVWAPLVTLLSLVWKVLAPFWAVATFPLNAVWALARDSMDIQLVVYGIIQAIYGVVFCFSLVWVLFISGVFILDMFNGGATKALETAKELYRDHRLLVLCLASLATFGASALFPFTMAAVCTSLATSLGILPLLAVNWPPPQDRYMWLCISLATPLVVMLLCAYQHPDAAWAPLVTLLSLVLKVLAPFWAVATFPVKAVWALATLLFRVTAASIEYLILGVFRTFAIAYQCLAVVWASLVAFLFMVPRVLAQLWAPLATILGIILWRAYEQQNGRIPDDQVPLAITASLAMLGIVLFWASGQYPAMVFDVSASLAIVLGIALLLHHHHRDLTNSEPSSRSRRLKNSDLLFRVSTISATLLGILLLDQLPSILCATWAFLATFAFRVIAIACQGLAAVWGLLVALLSIVLARFWALATLPFRALTAVWTLATFPFRVLAAFEAFGQRKILAAFEAIFRALTAYFSIVCHVVAALSAFQISAAFLASSAVIKFLRYLIIRKIRLERWNTRDAGKYPGVDERRLVSNCPANPRPDSITMQCCNTHNVLGQGRQAVVVLTEFEAEFPCGSFTVNELHQELNHFWCDSQDNKFDVTWLQYFIKSDSPFGFVYAWAGAVIAHHDSLPPKNFNWKPDDFDASLTCCAQDDRAGFIEKKKDQGSEFIRDASDSANPRRVWDIASNKVIPGTWVRRSFAGKIRIWAISHAWAPDNERRYIWTSVNNYQWPVPIPQDVTLEDLREDLIGLGCRYAWLDVLCLRQEYPEEERETMHSLQEFERREQLRLTEWKIDVPTIGFLYCAPSPVVIYFNRLGKPFEPRNWKLDHKNHWLNRAWTLQEAVDLDRISIGGRKNSTTPIEDLFNTQVDHTTTVSQRLQYLLNLKDETASKIVLIKEMARRHAANYVDKVVGLMAILSPNIRELPIYKANEEPHDAWNGWMHRIHTAFQNSPEFTLAHQLVTLFPHPSKDYWFPSWNQVIKFPDVSLRERNEINRKVPQPPISNILFPFQLGGLICNSTLYESCRLRKSGNTYEASYGELEVPLISTLEDESLPNVGIEDFGSYALIDITVPQALPKWLHWMSGCRLLLVCQELGRTEVEPNDLVDPCYRPCTCVWSRKEVIRLRRITTLMFRPTVFHPKIPFIRRAKHIVPDGTCVGSLFSLE